MTCSRHAICRLTSFATRLRGIFRIRSILCRGRWDGGRGACRLRGFDGDDVPGVLGDDVGDDEIDFVLGGDVMSFPSKDTAVGDASELYLHAPQATIPAHDEVEAFAVSMGLGDSEAEACCFADER
jgi:hypothetical protein